MVKVNLSSDVFQWLQSLAEPLVDTPDDVLRKIMLEGIRVPNPPSSPPTTFGNSRESGDADDLTKALAHRIVDDLRALTGDLSIDVRWQPKGKRFTLLCSKGVFANIHSFQPRKGRARLEVPGNLVDKANIATTVFDKTWSNGWYKLYPSHLMDISRNGGHWDASEYKSAVGILKPVWQAR